MPIILSTFPYLPRRASSLFCFSESCSGYGIPVNWQPPHFFETTQTLGIFQHILFYLILILNYIMWQCFFQRIYSGFTFSIILMSLKKGTLQRSVPFWIIKRWSIIFFCREQMLLRRELPLLQEQKQRIRKEQLHRCSGWIHRQSYRCCRHKFFR